MELPGRDQEGLLCSAPSFEHNPKLWRLRLAPISWHSFVIRTPEAFRAALATSPRRAQWEGVNWLRKRTSTLKRETRLGGPAGEQENAQAGALQSTLEGWQAL